MAWPQNKPFWAIGVWQRRYLQLNLQMPPSVPTLGRHSAVPIDVVTPKGTTYLDGS